MANEIIYIDKQEILDFVRDAQQAVQGLSYTWENEHVTHLHVKPIAHSFGSVGKAFFMNEECQAADFQPANGDYRVVVKCKDNNAEDVNLDVERLDDGQWTRKEFTFIPSKAELFSRNKGILEVDTLASKRVLIIGLGSFGSQIAIELAKAGVGNFALMDFDRVELHNLARHTCGTQDLGRLKTDAISDAIQAKNPYAKVDKFDININEHLDVLNEQVNNCDLVIVATDNNQSRFNISEALLKAKKVGIFGRAITRAEGGDVFRYHPGGPCYNCLIGLNVIQTSQEEVSSEEAGRRAGRIAAYMSPDDVNAVVQVGLSADIQPICNMMIKLALVELSRGTQSGIASLEDDLVYDFYIWANRRDQHYANWPAMPSAGPRPTILRWYGVRVPKDEDCALCGTPHLHQEDEIQAPQMGDLANINLDDLDQ